MTQHPDRPSRRAPVSRRRRRRASCLSSLRARFESLEIRQAPAGVTATLPTADSHNALVSTDISATFNATIENSTVTDQTFVVHARETSRLLLANGDITSLGASGMTITLNPAADFHPGELVQVTATAGIQDTTPAAVDSSNTSPK